MPSSYDRAAALAAIKEKHRRKKQRGPWGGAVLRRVQLVQHRQQVGCMLLSMPDDVLRMLFTDAFTYAACSLVCKDWHVAYLRIYLFHVCVAHVLPYLPPSHIVTVTSVSHAFRVRFRRVGDKARIAACRKMWLGARVRIAWPEDDVWEDDHHVYAGVVLRVLSRGRAVRVMFDEPVGDGPYQSGACRVHKISVARLERE